MKKVLKWAVPAGIAVMILVVVLLLVIPLFVDVKLYKPLIEKEVSGATGRSFSIAGDLRFFLFPSAGVSFSDLRLGNPPGFPEGEFVSIKSFDAKIRLIPLLFRDVEIRRFVLDEPRVVLMKDGQGRGNWETPRAKPPEPQTAESRPTSEGSFLPVRTLKAGEFAVRNGTVVWMDDRGGKTEITALDVVLEDLSLDKPIRIGLSGRWDGRPFSMKGTAGPLGPKPGRGDVPLDLVVSFLDEIAVRAKGRVTDPAADPRVDLSVAVDAFSPRKAAGALGKPFPVKTADPAALGRLALAARIAGGKAEVAVSDGKLQLDDTVVRFSARAKEFPKPDVAFDIRVDRIDLDRYLPPSSKRAQEGGETPEEGKAPASGKDAMDYGPLRRLVLEGWLKVDEYRIMNARVEGLQAGISGKDGVFTVKPVQMRLYGGTGTGWKTVDVRGRVPAAAGSFSLRGVRAGPLLNDVLKKDFLEGVAAAELKISATGDTPETILRSLAGDGKLKLSDGAVKGIDLASMARNVEAAFGMETAGPRPRTDFAEIDVPFTISKGIVNVPKASMKSPFLRLEASGKADLAGRTLDFRVVPRAVATMQGQGDRTARSGIMVPILISGTFEKPLFMPDLKSILTREIEKGIVETKTVKQFLEKEGVKKIEEPAKTLLKDLMGK
jgi:AsmA protein